MAQQGHNIKQNQQKALLSEAEDSTYIHAATSDNTRAAYRADMNHFIEKGGILPASPEAIESYLKQCAPQYNPRTLKRRLSALRQWHKLKGYPDPTDNPAVTKTMRGIARLHGKPRKKAAALRLQDLDLAIAYLDQKKTLLNIRDKALLLMGFFGAFRSAELVLFDWEQIHFVSEGMIIMLDRSKTDQFGEGESCPIPFGDEKRCPVRALIDWRAASQQWEGKIFRRITKGGNISASAISSRHWNRLIKQLAQNARLPNAERITSHSQRRGSTTEAARRGASLAALKRHGRWRSTASVLEYIEEGRQFTDSAVNLLFEFKE